ncbi:MAG: molybdopterin-guanine dinucleotide biosynthesis protein B [Chloroflexota bacterium]|nr:molybdopterin-guanine dinucleotide biosynthesis protein B [Chloroflexota bacterium]
MPQVIGIVGYKDSGKTTLTHRLARELIGRGYEVAVIKHTSHHLDLPGKDTAILRESVGQVGIISAQESALFWNKPLSLENIIPYLEADIVLVEGFKTEKSFPKIACLRGEPDDRDLLDGLAICAVLSPSSQGGAEGEARVEGVDVPFLDRDAVIEIADMVERRAFKLPNLNCGGCGYERCYDLAREIVAGTGSVEDCVSLQPATEVKIDGQPMPMNSFISSIVKSTVLGVLAPLKGFRKGEIEIRI